LFYSYAVNTKGYRFYCPSSTSKVVETRNAKFLEEHEVSGNGLTLKVELEEVREPFSMEPLQINYVPQPNSQELVEE
jgi:hypothetical protein